MRIRIENRSGARLSIDAVEGSRPPSAGQERMEVRRSQWNEATVEFDVYPAQGEVIILIDGDAAR